MRIETARLLLRPWTEADKPAFRAIINTPAMMEHFGGVRPDDQVDALIDRQIDAQATDGFSMGGVDLREGGALVGICGVRVQRAYAGTPVFGMLEIGWRIAEPLWGKGIAHEAAEASIGWAWANTDFPGIAAWTTSDNARSWGLMERLGMRRATELDFQHPQYPADDPHGWMIVYTIDRPS